MGMMGLDSLASLDTISSVGNAVSNAASAVATAADESTFGIFSGNTTKYVTIILGLLFIAAGIFSFDKTRELVVTAGKTAAAAAA